MANKSDFFFFFYTLYLCREEVRLLREELTEEYEVDKQAALTQLSQQKELEMMAAREGWQRKVEDLLEQVKRMGELFWLQLSIKWLSQHNSYLYTYLFISFLCTENLL